MRVAGACRLAVGLALAWPAVSRAQVEANDEPGCEVEEGASSFLQTGRHLAVEEACGYLTNDLGDPTTFFNNNCKYHSHGADCARPIQDVMAEHPHVDGFCYFNSSAMYIGYTPNNSYSYEEQAGFSILGLRSMDSMGSYKGVSTGPEIMYDFEGKKVSSHMDLDHYVYDDLYAYALGALQGQGLDVRLLQNASAWEAVSKQKCDEIQEAYHFTREDMVLGELLDMNMPLMAMSYCTAHYPVPPNLRIPYVTEKAQYHSQWDCTPATRKEFARHHYMKCLLGYKNSAADLAYLIARACLLGSRIGHLSECPYQPSLDLP